MQYLLNRLVSVSIFHSNLISDYKLHNLSQRVWQEFGEILAKKWRKIFLFLSEHIIMNYPYYNNYFQPQRQELIKVNGIEGAKNYPLSPGSTVALFDVESDIMYIKSMDAGGFPSIRTFTFSEAISTPPSDVESRISSLETEIAQLKEALNGIKPISKQKQTTAQ